MSGLLNLLPSAAGLVLDNVLIAPITYYRAIGPEGPGGSFPGMVFSADVTEREEHRDQLYVTEHPVEVGVAVSDHAYKRPADVELRVGWSNSTAFDPYAVQAVYALLVRLQADRTPFNLYTGKRAYFNMLLAGMVVATDQSSEYVLLADLHLRQVFLVQTQQYTIGTDPSRLGSPQTALPTQQQGTQVVQPAGGVNTSAPLPPAVQGAAPSSLGSVPIHTGSAATSVNPSSPGNLVPTINV